VALALKQPVERRERRDGCKRGPRAAAPRRIDGYGEQALAPAADVQRISLTRTAD